MKVSELIGAAEEIFKDKNRWIQGTMAQTKSGQACMIESENAYCFCSMGVLLRLAPLGTVSGTILEKAISYVEDVAGGSIVRFNDTSSYGEVIEGLRKAKQLALKDEENESVGNISSN